MNLVNDALGDSEDSDNSYEYKPPALTLEVEKKPSNSGSLSGMLKVGGESPSPMLPRKDEKPANGKYLNIGHDMSKGSKMPDQSSKDTSSRGNVKLSKGQLSQARGENGNWEDDAVLTDQDSPEKLHHVRSNVTQA